MLRPKLILRLLYINWILVFHGLDKIILATHLFRPIRYFAFLSPNFWLRKVHEPRGVGIRRTLEDLGPIFVKFGQALSTRRDLLPEDIADELQKLQDKVPPFNGALARQIVEKELGRPISEGFASFDETPLASASIAQVHTAELPDGTQVIVKVLRPNVEQHIKNDIELLYELARLAQKFWVNAKRLRPLEVVAEFEKTIIDELDLIREGANASELGRNFEASEMLYIPKIYWDWTRTKVLVMERIYGIPVRDIERLREANVDFKLLAERGVEIFFTQVLRDNFFHADMHPGNIFVTPESSYIAVDFGIVGSLTYADQHYLAYNLLAFFNRDYRRVAELHVESGWVDKNTRVDELESGIRAVCEPIFQKPISEISYGNLLLRLFQAARRFNAEVQPQLVLFQKTLLNIEGLGRELYPQLDLWQTAKPFLENWFKEQVGPKATFKKVRKQLPDWAEQLPELPGLVHHLLSDASKGELEVRWQSRQLDELRKQIQQNHHHSIAATTGGALIVSAAVLVGLNGTATVTPGNIPMLIWLCGITGALFLVYSFRN